MGFKINTNIAAMNSHNNAIMNNRNLDSSLSKLSSGLRINTAADDASGMAIADSLRSQASSLGQAINNANDAIGVIQTADKAMDEQLKILDTIKTKAIQAASDGQNAVSREAIQKDINRLIEQLDNIAKTTSFNGQTLLNGNYTNKEYQIGAFSNQTVKASVDNTQSFAIGNTSQRSDVASLGNQTSAPAAAADIAKNTTTIKISQAWATGINVKGLAVGDTIRIDGVGDYTIKDMGGTISGSGKFTTGFITLDRGLEKTITKGTVLKIANLTEAAESLSSVKLAAVNISNGTLSVADMTGFSNGDQIRFTNSDGTSVVATVKASKQASVTTGAIKLSGTLTFTAAAAFALSAGAKMEIVSRSSVGTAMSSADYLQYTVEGVTLRGVQMTDSSGYGVADTGLGKIADLINATTQQTGVKAVAVVEKNSAIRVQGMTLAADIKINGETILQSGTTIQSGDANNTLVNAINAKASKTGVSAALETDGSITLTSDGRAMNVSGMSAVAGISDGIIAGTLNITKNNLSKVDVSSKHYSDANLSTLAGAASTLTEIEAKNNLRDLVTGSENGTTGLLRTKAGAMRAMDIVESAITKLDSTRADLGSVQNQLVVTVNNISVTQVNVKAAESQIRDVDFAAESANFSKFNILAQSGSYAMSQANAVQQNVLRLLQ